MIFALHGFLGSALDWQELKNLVPEHDWLTPSLFGDFKWPTRIEFETVVSQLREYYYLPTLKNNPEIRKLFLGYSLGGRIGLYWLEFFPHDFDSWYFVSTHPGLQSDADRNQRRNSDLQWVEKLNNLEQSVFLDLWNTQDVFKNTKAGIRSDLIWNKKLLSQALIQLSLSQQKDFSTVLSTQQNKIHWIVGKEDQKFANIGLKLKKDMKIQNLHILNGGHRIYLDQPQSISHLLNTF